MVYKHYYPSCSLILRDHLFTTPSPLEPVPTPGSAPVTYSHRRRYSPGNCPDADNYSLLPHRKLSNASPNLDLILVWRDVYRFANPIFQDTYERILMVRFAGYHLLGDGVIRKYLCRRYEPLPSRMHTLDIDISNISSFQGRGEVGSFSLTTILPKLQTLIIQDAFTCTNTTSLLAKYPDATQSCSSDKESKARSADFKDLVREAITKRMQLPQAVWIAGGVRDGFDGKKDQKYWGASCFVLWMRMEGVTRNSCE